MDNNFSNFTNSSLLQKNSFDVGKYKILLPKIFGFCGGVISALKKLENTVRQNQGINIFLLGEIIHNPTVNDYFSKQGVKIIPENELDSIFELASFSDIVVIPAFGIPLKIEYKLRKFFHNIVDTTCVNVRSVWEFVSKKAEENHSIILYGKPGHPEVTASISRAKKNNSIIILPDLERAELFSSYFTNGFPKLPNCGNIVVDGIHWIINELVLDKFAFANQTTMLFSETKKIENILKASITKSGKYFTSCDTICNATFLRQKAAKQLCEKNPDLIVVIGGYDSSNTNHLYSLASKKTKTLYLKNSKSLSKNTVLTFSPESKKEVPILRETAFNNVKSIGILAGASCPFSEIETLIYKLK